MTDVADRGGVDAALIERSGRTSGRAVDDDGDAAALRTPLDDWLAVQADLSAVERFSRADDAGRAGRGTGTWHDVVPLERPGPDERYAFEVDLDSCTGCKACVAACNSLNGLDPGESFRTVGVLVGLDRRGAAVQQTVTTACHHCADPACLTGCPVDAYEVDVSTGIVAHLDDQCIGCGYCTLTCPYEVPRMNERLGIVRKCDLCRGRLADGEAPACAQACPTGAIAVRVVDRAEAAPVATDAAAALRLVPGAPASALTRPSTRYRSRRPLPDTMAATDAASAPIAHGHPALAVMLVLTQVAVGALVVEQGVVVLAPDDAARLEPWGPLLGLATGVLALGASVLHLGRPRYALRAVIGFRHSWLSREIVAFGAFAGLAALNAGMALLGPEPGAASGALRVAAVLAGIAGIACSVLLYAVTGRDWWRVAVTGPKFALTGAVGGLAAVLAVAAVVEPDPLAVPVAALLAAATTVKLATEAAFLRHCGGDPADTRTRSARLLTGALGGITAWRFTLGSLGGLVLPLMLVACLRSDPVPQLAVPLLGLAVLLVVVVGELLERLTFFTASVAPRMPGSRP
jgi:Fe-S-cluster-containing dehydrogenase component/DMSO reductase anchor subunit